MNKGLKIAFLAIAATLAAVGILLAIEYYKYTQSDEYRAIKELERLGREYQNDPYGGSTPEETLQLFIDALKAGDTNLAAKYFVMEGQEEWKANLKSIKDAGGLTDMIGDISRAKKYDSSSADQAFFTVGNENGEAIADVDIIKIPNGKWKIRSL